jgi:hypothetical protein
MLNFLNELKKPCEHSNPNTECPSFGLFQKILANNDYLGVPEHILDSFHDHFRKHLSGQNADHEGPKEDSRNQPSTHDLNESDIQVEASIDEEGKK